jgi:hypothetical protein
VAGPECDDLAVAQPTAQSGQDHRLGMLGGSGQQPLGLAFGQERLAAGWASAQGRVPAGTAAPVGGVVVRIAILYRGMEDRDRHGQVATDRRLRQPPVPQRRRPCRQVVTADVTDRQVADCRKQPVLAVEDRGKLYARGTRRSSLALPPEKTTRFGDCPGGGHLRASKDRPTAVPTTVSAARSRPSGSK